MYFFNLIGGVGLGLLFSYYISKKMPASGFFRVLLFMPSIISGAVLAAIFKQATALAFGGGFGLFKQWFDVSINFWDAEHKYASTMFFNIFTSFGTSVLMYTNKMDSIDPEIVESAHLDGADGVKEFWYIILPQAFSIVQVFLMTGFAAIFSNQLNALMLFDYNVGPEIQTVGYMLWRGVASSGGDITQMGPYAALGLMITFIIVPLTFLLRWTMQKVGWKED
jgi:ABC-type sugar transport system permease subunit